MHHRINENRRKSMKILKKISTMTIFLIRWVQFLTFRNIKKTKSNYQKTIEHCITWINQGLVTVALACAATAPGLTLSRCATEIESQHWCCAARRFSLSRRPAHGRVFGAWQSPGMNKTKHSQKQKLFLLLVLKARRKDSKKRFE